MKRVDETRLAIATTSIQGGGPIALPMVAEAILNICKEPVHKFELPELVKKSAERWLFPYSKSQYYKWRDILIGQGLLRRDGNFFIIDHDRVRDKTKVVWEAMR